MKDTYNNPLISRYASKEMSYLFSPDFKFSTWRKLWVVLAECEKELGLDYISEDDINQLKKYVNELNYETMNMYEQKFRHDVMANVHAYGDLVGEEAKKIIHLGVTSAYVQDNTDLITYKEALKIIKDKCIYLLDLLCKFALDNKDIPTLGYTHFQPAQLTTVGKRATLWINSLYEDTKDIINLIDNMPFRGVKGTTGTQASFKTLFNNDYDKVLKLDKMVSNKMGFNNILSVCGQTYDRKIDTKVLQVLNNIAETSLKFSNDLRLLQHEHEVEEPFGKDQIGSSAMAYKQNPMRSERISSLAKFVLSLTINGSLVSSNQWFERTLDDSANKRLSLPQSFLAVDGILTIWINIMKGIRVNLPVINLHVDQQLPFMITEEIMMKAVENGADRQVVHEVIRQHSIRAIQEVKEQGLENNLIKYLSEDKDINLSYEELNNMLDANLYTGFASRQTEDFINNIIKPFIHENPVTNKIESELKV